MWYLETFVEKEIEEDRIFLTVFFNHGMERYPHMNGYMLLDITRYGESWSPMAVSKELSGDDDDIQNTASQVQLLSLSTYLDISVGVEEHQTDEAKDLLDNVVASSGQVR